MEVEAPDSTVKVTGRTRLYGILADPISHVKTPQVMHELFAEHGVDGVLVPFHVKPGGLAAVLDGLRSVENFGGFIATVPHKTAMLKLCDQLTEQARLVGAVNCVRREADGRMIGAMLDGIGFVEGLRKAKVDPAGLRIHLAGAGGAARAIAFALAGAGVSSIQVSNRTIARAEQLVDALKAAHPDLELAATADGAPARETDLVVNATSLGMQRDDPLPVEEGALHSSQIVADAIMQPPITPLLDAARRSGCRIQPGLPMLQSQIRLMAEHMGAL
ncbi:shikimate dehydrogenase family protein [Limimaricola variabilis]